MTELEFNRTIPTRTLWLYTILLLVDIAVSVIAIYDQRIPMLVITIPVGIVVAFTLFTDRKTVHIPPILVIVLLVTMLIALVPARYEENDIAALICYIMVGVTLIFIGIILGYVLLDMNPEKFEDHHLLLYLVSFCIALSVLLIMLMVKLLMLKDEMVPIMDTIQEVAAAVAGALIGVALCELGLSKYIIDSRLNKSLADRHGTYQSNEQVLADSLAMIAAGESERLEFKSTMVINLMTGQKDPRMEKAVLKTINAFLNTKGGVLMIGVSDDGSICGVDESAFENRDKMGLHLTHIISSRIGDEFFAYISFRIIDVEEGKAIIRVNCEKCKKPVFLIDGKDEQFYVRSGPSSVELKGHDLVNYIKNRSDKNRKNILSELNYEEE